MRFVLNALCWHMWAQHEHSIVFQPLKWPPVANTYHAPNITQPLSTPHMTQLLTWSSPGPFWGALQARSYGECNCASDKLWHTFSKEYCASNDRDDLQSLFLCYISIHKKTPNFCPEKRLKDLSLEFYFSGGNVGIYFLSVLCASLFFKCSIMST